MGALNSGICFPFPDLCLLTYLYLFKDQLNSNQFIPIIGDIVRTVSVCLNGVRGAIYKPNPQRDARNQKVAQNDA